MGLAEEIRGALVGYADEKRAEGSLRFFKTGPGEYGEGDRFIGVTVPQQRKVARAYVQRAGLDDIEELLADDVHEYRLTALLLLVLKYQKAQTELEKEKIVHLYLQNTHKVNNWDLVDSSADKILGAYLFDKDKNILYKLAGSENQWEQRISVIATFYFIRQGEFENTLRIARILLEHPHDLIHKAVGWMLREVGKRDFDTEVAFLKEHYPQMPRTMLRYAIEKFDPSLRTAFLQGNIKP
ncbi:MAG: DNA alkylation repair protein [Bacillota bacterium]|nr:DNA alkylation repair protein [Bacillota bacterium]MDW7682789.1 DNA alkylation repair protein [Bacillota bacterium]